MYVTLPVFRVSIPPDIYFSNICFCGSYLCVTVSAVWLKPTAWPQWWGLLWLSWKGFKKRSKCTHLIWAPKGLMGNCQCLINFHTPSFRSNLESVNSRMGKISGPCSHDLKKWCVTGRRGSPLTLQHGNSAHGCSKPSFPPHFTWWDWFLNNLVWVL